MSYSDVTFYPSLVGRTGEALPEVVANVWVEGVGVIDQGELHPDYDGVTPPPLPANIRLRENGELIIHGSKGDDSILVSAEADSIVVQSNGARSELPAILVSSLFIAGFEGDDVIENRTRLNSSILGGLGADILIGGDGQDAILGGEGNDEIRSGGGDDFVWGSTGDDLLYGGAGRDKIRGDDGRDTIFGDAGDDPILSGGPGVDQIFGGTGNDVINGDAGDDTLRGGIGDDSLTGGTGADTLWGEDGLDATLGW